MLEARLQRFDVADPTHGLVPCAALLPGTVDAQTPMCLFLYGGGGGRETLADIRPLLEAWWASGALAPMIVATPDVGPWSFYLDDAARGMAWESFIALRFLPQLRAAFTITAPLGIVGISMGGYGALKLAFARPQAVRAVAAISPMIEPSCEAGDVRPRNRFHYPPAVPQALLGAERDAALYRSDQPAARAHAQQAALRANALAIYIDAAGDDALNAHDGAEFLHRTLWQLDVAHEYRLRRDSDHAGPDMAARLREAFAWVSARLQPAAAAPLSELELAWQRFLEDRSAPPPSAAPPAASPLFTRWLREQLAPQRTAAAAHDPTLARRYGLL